MPLGSTGTGLWRRRTTRAYPRKPAEARYQPDLLYDESGQVKCVACQLCVSVCPTECLYFAAEAAQGQEREKQPQIAEIDLARCLVCGLCAAACPQEAIALVPRKQLRDGLRRDMVGSPSA